jgi:hypothetical protein
MKVFVFFYLSTVMFGRFLLRMKTPIITAPKTITAPITERYSPIDANAGVGETVAEVVGVGVGVVVGVEVGAEVGAAVG